MLVRVYVWKRSPGPWLGSSSAVFPGQGLWRENLTRSRLLRMLSADGDGFSFRGKHDQGPGESSEFHPPAPDSKTGGRAHGCDVIARASEGVWEPALTRSRLKITRRADGGRSHLPDKMNSSSQAREDSGWTGPLRESRGRRMESDSLSWRRRLTSVCTGSSRWF